MEVKTGCTSALTFMAIFSAVPGTSTVAVTSVVAVMLLRASSNASAKGVRVHTQARAPNRA